MKTIFEESVAGREGCWPCEGLAEEAYIPKELLRDGEVGLPSASELDVVRHFTRLSQRNFGVDGNFYPLGSCTMKYNPKFTEVVAAMPGFTRLHPVLPQLRGAGGLCQGALEVMYETEALLSEITGMSAFTLHPMAGAHGELTGVMLMAAYHKDRGNRKTKVIVPDSAHGTNPASAAIAGFDVVSVESKDGIVDPAAPAEVLDDEVAGMMMTCPNTLGLFEKNLPEIVKMLRKVDALLYYDGANLNAIMGKMRVGDVGFDIVHLNLHKTFATPHGGGGPGSGPVGVSEKVAPFLPISRVAKREDGRYFLDYDQPKSIGYVAPFYGNFGVYLKAYAYILRLGGKGLTRATENAVLAANYMRKRLCDHFEVPYNRICMHEFVASASPQAKKGVHALDFAKGLLDKGYHAPTVYFPLIVPEAIMIEPTETENKETLDQFCDDLIELAGLVDSNPGALTSAPVTLPVTRLDETKAARSMELTDDLDLVVIGAGPGGFDAAVEAAGLGLSVALVEKDFLGGTCLNRGCIPTKLWLGATSAIEELHNQARMKVASGEVTVNFAGLQNRVQKHLAGTRKAMALQLGKLGVELVEGMGRLSGDHRVAVATADGERTLDYKKLVVATGSRPIFFPGLEPDGECVLDSDMFLSMNAMPESLIVVGAGFIGLEMAQVAHRFGCKITVVDAMDRVAPLEDPEVSKALAGVFKRWKWDIRLEERVAGVLTRDGKAELTLQTGDKLIADKALVAVGRGPVTQSIGLEEAGVELVFNQIQVDDYLMAAPDIYAIGDANGHIQLAHAASHQAHYVALHAAGKTEAPYACPPVPSVLYGAPEAMRVGMMENEAFLADFDTTEVSTAQLAANPMAQAHAATQGFVKVVWSGGRVVGVTAVGHDVSRPVTPAAMIVNQGWMAKDVHSIIFAHPSLDEALLMALTAERKKVQ